MASNKFIVAGRSASLSASGVGVVGEAAGLGPGGQEAAGEGDEGGPDGGIDVDVELLGHPEHGRPGDYYQDVDALYFVGPAPPQQAVLPQSLGLIVAANVSEWSVRGIAMQEATWKLSDS